MVFRTRETNMNAGQLRVSAVITLIRGEQGRWDRILCTPSESKFTFVMAHSPAEAQAALQAFLALKSYLTHQRGIADVSAFGKFVMRRLDMFL
jgi:hypothetical protein